MKIIWLCTLTWGLAQGHSQAQSLEVMPGTQGVFWDVQWLKPIDETGPWSVFSRTTVSASPGENAFLYSGNFLNFTLPLGLGVSAVGSATNAGLAAHLGAHYFRGGEDWMLFTIVASEVVPDWEIWGFSIFRYRPQLSEQWRAYTSLELYSSFSELGHLFSTQRIRLGLDRDRLQGGLAANLSGVNAEYTTLPSHWGVFLRTEF